MQYQGGKSRISKSIAEVIENEVLRRQEQNSETDSCGYRERESNCDTLVSLFCGSCSIESKVNIPNKICNDKHPYLIAMWQGLQNGWIPPDVITEEEYKYIREHKDENPALTGFVGFGCSFGGKWFGGYAKGENNRNYCLNAKRTTLRDFEGIKDAKFICLDYKDVKIPNDAIVIADPPYANTTGYTTGYFNIEEFWQYIREISKKHIVLICEQTAPDDFEVVWEQELKRTLDYNKNNYFKVTEKLFKWKGESE